MKSTRVVVIIVALVVCCAAESLLDVWQRYSTEYRTAKQQNNSDLAARVMSEWQTAFPYHSRLLAARMAGAARSGDTKSAKRLYSQFADMGLVVDSETASALKAAGIPAAESATVVQSGEKIFSAPDPNLLVEDVAYDPASQMFYLASVRQRKIVRCNRAGQCTDFATNVAQRRMWGVLALRIDSQRRVLWAATAALAEISGFDKAETGKSALLKLDLRTGNLIRRFELSDGAEHSFGDMTLGPAGEVYLADSRGGIYLVSANGTSLEPLVPAGTFLSPQTPALRSDGTTLFVPDYALGLAAVRLSDRTVRWMTSFRPIAFNGIDGLYTVGNSLIAVQNGTNPQRIVRLNLQDDSIVSSFQVLEAAWPGLGEPTHAAIVGDEMYFIANSGWDRAGENGEFKAGPAAEVWRASLATTEKTASQTPPAKTASRP